MERQNGKNLVTYVPLLSICEHTEFCSKEGNRRTDTSPESINTRNAHSTRHLSVKDHEELVEEEQPLLYSKACYEQRKPKRKLRRKVQKPELAKGWKMEKKVKTAWEIKTRRLRASMKALALCPLLFLKTIRDAYVRAMRRMESKCNERMWHLSGATVF